MRNLRSPEHPYDKVPPNFQALWEQYDSGEFYPPAMRHLWIIGALPDLALIAGVGIYLFGLGIYQACVYLFG